ncbi:hypothetical protein CDO52_12850 [Nocardiopsis gilva YIM 90087]|uniref:Uncharacterized protein n=1 Tax=Nocardiopsis gilva YIM 90087 TaxID=1235441 RepID=A0A223S628_9ACTN|nr:DUF6011 domain-containing protein [Nocardiopsis gilva]ASU83558.1 hypothetical protein CDO52_12850 [Nocardiopsis gilva YIM 90087]
MRPGAWTPACGWPPTESSSDRLPDPHDPGQITYWRRDDRGRLNPWPAKARYGPALYRSQVPAGLTGPDRRAWAQDWHRTHRHPWDAAIRSAIDADPDACRARFAAFTTRCCSCGRALSDPESKTVGVGPECRAGVPADMLGRLAVLVGRAHATALSASDVPQPAPTQGHPEHPVKPAFFRTVSKERHT